MLEVRALQKSYGGRTVVHPISFTLGVGECMGVAGANGCGKSTLLSMLAQTQRADSGDILFRGHSVRGDRKFLRSTLGYVPQECELAPELTVAQQIDLWQAACGRRGALPDRVSALLGLRELMNCRIESLSGGMRRRVSIALALSGRPEILIMDEVTAGLDETYCRALLDWLEQYLQNGGRVIWCSHHKDELERLCSRCLVLKDGRGEWSTAFPNQNG